MNVTVAACGFSPCLHLCIMMYPGVSGVSRNKIENLKDSENVYIH